MKASFTKFAHPRGNDVTSAMMIKRNMTVITDRRLTRHSLNHGMKDKRRNSGYPAAIPKCVSNTMAANYGSG